MKINVKGNGVWIELISQSINCMVPMIIQGIVVDAEGTDITKKKGKYIKDIPFTKILTSGGINPLTDGFIAQGTESQEYTIETNFDIPVSEEEFDPKKLQFIKSDYEFSEYPYGILADRVLYDGVEYYTDANLTEELDDLGSLEYYAKYTLPNCEEVINDLLKK